MEMSPSMIAPVLIPLISPMFEVMAAMFYLLIVQNAPAI